MANKIVLLSILALIIATSIGFVLMSQSNDEDYKQPTPTDTVKQYFTAWNNKNYPDMYATVSDGFKKIEPTAKTLSDFRQYVESQNIIGVKTLDIKEKSNDGKAAVVDYFVEFTLSNSSKTMSGSFTLKYREADIIKGWKLIHPYGNNIDTVQ